MTLVLVGIGGPLSSGKTTVACALHLIVPKSTLVHLDDFYYPDHQIPVGNDGNQNWDCAEAIDWTKFRNYISEIRESGGKVLPMKTLEMDSELVLSSDEIAMLRLEVSFGNCHLVFVDGFMLFHEEDIMLLFDVKLFFRAPYKVLKTRRENRLGYNTVAGFWTDPPNYFDTTVWPEFVRSHLRLFVDGDVEGVLSERSLELGLVDVVNDGTRSLMDLIRQSMKAIEAKTSELKG